MTTERKLLHEASDCLGASSHLFLRHVRCHLEGDAVCLEGKVPSFYLKQTAQSLVKAIDGVRRVDNRLQVVSAYGVSSEPAEL